MARWWIGIRREQWQCQALPDVLVTASVDKDKAEPLPNVEQASGGRTARHDIGAAGAHRWTSADVVTQNHDGGLLFPAASARANPRRTRRQRYHWKPDRRLSTAQRRDDGTEAVSASGRSVRPRVTRGHYGASSNPAEQL